MPAAGGGGGIEPIQKLRSHTGSILCCAASVRSDTAAVVSSSEDGSVCIFDLRSSSCSMRLNSFGGAPVASVCSNPGNDNELYAAARSIVYLVDVRLGSSSGRELLHKYDFNLDDINQVVVNQKATYLAAADDAGEVKVIDLNNRKLLKTLRGVHISICSAVQFQTQRPWEVISGGLDSKIAKWDFSRGKELRSFDLLPGTTTQDVGQLFNPPFVHALATPEGDGSGEIGRLVAVARGDGAVQVYDSGFSDERKIAKSESSRRKTGKSAKMRNPQAGEESSREAISNLSNGIRRHLDREQGGHLTAVSSVTFGNFGDRGRYIVSGGNDKLIKIWDWFSQSEALVLEIGHSKKVNWLSTSDRSNGNIVVADTSKVLSIYQVL